MSRFSFIMALVLLVLPAKSYAATLQGERQKCQQECTSSNGALLCQLICDCAVERMHKTLGQEGFDRFVKDAENGTLSKADLDMSNEVGMACFAQADMMLGQLRAQNPAPKSE